ncbi:putative gp22 [Burkholderia multivorans]|nr:putative gp22 [Burkholderia multivorans]
MSVGFQAFTDSGLYQIDGNTPNFQCVQSLVAVSQSTNLPVAYNDVGRWFDGTFWIATFSFTANTPLYAFAADGGVGATIWDHQVSGNFHTIRIVTWQQTTVRFFVFDTTPPVGGNFGLQVFSATGALIADSSRPFYRVLDAIHIQYVPGYGWNNQGVGFPHPPTESRSYGRPVLVSCPFPCHNLISGDGTYRPSLTLFQTGGNTVTWYQQDWMGTPPYWVGFNETYHLHFLVIDGTGLI